MAHTHREFRTEDIPLAYLISFRAYGTWIRGWVLLALNARTNHIYTVVSANSKPEPVLATLNAEYAQLQNRKR